MKSEVVTLKMHPPFKEHLQKQAKKAKMPLGTYIKKMMAENTGYVAQTRDIL